jgi:hypothetical protein
MVSVASAWEVAVMVTDCPCGGINGAVYTPCEEILPVFRITAGLFVFATLQLTGTIAPVEAVALQSS